MHIHNSLIMPLFKINSVNVYGPKIWYVIHLLAYGYQEKEKLLYHPYQAFITAVKELLPCKICRDHFNENIQKYPLEAYLSNGENSFLWSYLIHNEVNESRNRVSPLYSTCLKFTKEQLNTLEILPNLFYTLFTLTSSNHDKQSSYIIVLLTSLKYLIPQGFLRALYNEAFAIHHNDLMISPLFCVYSIYKDIYEHLNLYYYSYTIILKHFHIPS